MKYFLAKTDPETYSIEDLKKDGKTTWDGVKNPAAVKALKEMKAGDVVLIYHSQGETTIRGLAKVIGNSRPDPKEPKSWLVDFEFVKEFSEPYVTLGDVKKSGKFADFSLVRRGRLSTMSVPNEFVEWLKERTSL